MHDIRPQRRQFVKGAWMAPKQPHTDVAFPRVGRVLWTGFFSTITSWGLGSEAAALLAGWVVDGGSFFIFILGGGTRDFPCFSLCRACRVSFCLETGCCLVTGCVVGAIDAGGSFVFGGGLISARVFTLGWMVKGSPRSHRPTLSTNSRIAGDSSPKSCDRYSERSYKEQ